MGFVVFVVKKSVVILGDSQAAPDMVEVSIVKYNYT